LEKSLNSLGVSYEKWFVAGVCEIPRKEGVVLSPSISSYPEETFSYPEEE
jgi:hypothetical protein